jgi:exodeoxyribonuclease VII large subunit
MGQSQRLSVSALLAQAKSQLESQFMGVWVEGEIANFRPAPSGHWYFTLKDATAELKMAMFRGRNIYASVYPANGMIIRARGRVTVFEARGELQMVADAIEEAGAGALAIAFEQLKAKLQAEGLFDSDRKRQLLRTPRRIALISSPSGAAVMDFLTVLERRFPLLQVDLWPSLVQGEQAPAQLLAAINGVNQFADLYDALVLTRGGGSALDLNCFNDEQVVRSLANSKVFTVCAVGHETDHSLCDFVADLRAATPTAAAELITPDQAVLRNRIDALQRAISQRFRQQIQPKLQRLDYARRLLEAHSPITHLANQRTRLQRAQLSLTRLMQRSQANRQSDLANAAQRLRTQHPAQLAGPRALANLQTQAQQLSKLNLRLRGAAQIAMERTLQRLHFQHSGLLALNPTRTLARGYVMVRREQSVISSAAEVVHPSELQLQFADGQVSVHTFDKKLSS